MLNPHVCHVDCNLIEYPTGAKAHMMYASEPSSAAGRYQWEQNAAIKRQGRRAWRATGQGESRAVREWNERWRQSRVRDAEPLFPVGRAMTRFVESMRGTDWAANHPLSK